MSRWLLTILALGAVSACGSSAAGATASCGARGARTLAASTKARVYAHGGSVYACAGTGGRSYRLGSASRCIAGARVGPVTAAGTAVAYAVTRCGVDTASASVTVLRVSDGKQLLTRAAFSGPSAPEAFQAVGSIVVNRKGHVAWIVSDHSIATHHVVAQVIAARGSTHTRVLATGSAIGLGSLRLDRQRLTWTAGGVQHSATMG